MSTAGAPARSDQTAQVVQQFLRPLDGEDRHHDIAAAIDGRIQHLRQLVLDAAAVVVLAVAVGRLHHHVVSLGEDRGISQDRLVPLAHVAGKDQPPRLAVAPRAEFDHRRAQDMAGVVKHGRHPAHVHRLSVRHRIELLDRTFCVLWGIKRNLGILGRSSFACMPFAFECSVFHLQMRRIAKHHAHQVGRGRGRHHSSAKALLHQPRQEPAVIDVRVGQQHSLEVLGRHRIGLPVASCVVAFLEHAAVNKQPCAAAFQKILRSRYLPRGPQKLQSHQPIPPLYNAQ